MANNVGGGFQPDTKSESSRRADFDLLRRIAIVERNGGGGGVDMIVGGSNITVDSTNPAAPIVSTNPSYRTFTSIAQRDTWTDRPNGALAFTPEYGGTVWRWHAGLNKWLIQQIEAWVQANMTDGVAIPTTADAPATFPTLAGKNWVQGSAGRLRCQVPGQNLYSVDVVCITKGSTGGAYVQPTLKIQAGTTLVGYAMSVQGVHYWTGQTISTVIRISQGEDITVYGATDSSGTIWDNRSSVSAYFIGPVTA